MIVLEDGVYPQPAVPDKWIGRIIQCPVCKAILKLESGDPVTIVQDPIPGLRYRISTTCAFHSGATGNVDLNQDRNSDRLPE